MYNGQENCFKRKDFYYDTNPVNYATGNFAVQATCGTNHKPTIKVKLAPRDDENFDEKFK